MLLWGIAGPRATAVCNQDKYSLLGLENCVPLGSAAPYLLTIPRVVTLRTTRLCRGNRRRPGMDATNSRSAPPPAVAAAAASHLPMGTGGGTNINCHLPLET